MPRFATVVTRDISDLGVYLECRAGDAIPLYRLVYFQIERDGRDLSHLPAALRDGRVLSAVYRVGPSDCLRAKKFFEVNNIPHLQVGLEGNMEATEFVMKVNHGYRSVPTIVFPDGSILVEPGWEELKAKFSSS